MTSTLDPPTTQRSPLDPALVERLAAIVTAAPGRPRQASYAPFDGALVGEVALKRTPFLR